MEVQVKEKVKELMDSIDKQVLLCETNEELLMIASCMLSTAKLIFKNQLGDEGVKTLFMESLKYGQH